LDTEIADILTDTGTTLNNHLLDIKGTGFVKDTHSLPQCLTGGGGAAPTAAQVADAVWDEAAADHVAAGSFGAQCGTDIDEILIYVSTLEALLFAV